MILSYGGEIEVLEPANLRDELIRRLKKMNESYGL
ncbi:MAG: WYL domain-containing protein [Betaproteobacteria bacterium]|nr:WYL domain-containing protein [Betaproteobacteria bacterium]